MGIGVQWLRQQKQKCGFCASTANQCVCGASASTLGCLHCAEKIKYFTITFIINTNSISQAYRTFALRSDQLKCTGRSHWQNKGWPLQQPQVVKPVWGREMGETVSGTSKETSKWLFAPKNHIYKTVQMTKINNIIQLDYLEKVMKGEASVSFTRKAISL